MKSESRKKMLQSAAVSELSRPGLTYFVAACSSAVESLCLRSMTTGVLGFVLVSCATVPEVERLESAGSDLTTDTQSAALSEEPAEANEPVAVQSALYLGTDKGVQLPTARPPIRLDGDAVMLNFEQAPLNEVIHTILGDTLGLDYVIENQVPGEITLRTRSPIPRAQLLPILESLLRTNNVLMIRGPSDRFFISGSANIRSTVPSFESSPAEGYSNVIVPLQYISATEMAEILKPVARDDTFVRIDQSRNLLILAGTQIQLEGWLDIVSTFDVDQLAGMSVGIFPLQNATVEEVEEELSHIMSGPGGEGMPRIGALVKVMSIDRLNSLMVVSPRAHYIEAIRGWVEELDTIDQAGAEPTLQVYPVRNGNAGQLAGLLSTIYGGSAKGGSSTQGVAPGMAQAQSGSGMPANKPSRGGKSAGTGGTFDLGDDVRVVADEYNNSLLVYATPYEYQKIERILTKLDVVATQVLIEASIVEVQLNDELKYGLEWAFSNNLGGGDIGIGSLNAGSGPIAPQAPGFSYTISSGAGDFKAVLNALAEKSLVNVISTPSVMVLDNHTAAINVGTQQPIQSTSTITNGGNVQNSITYKDTGVDLQVTPSVNDGGLVTMDIDQSVTDVGLVDTATGQRSFLQRKVTSKVAVRSGESVVLGGLIRNNAGTSRSGVPWLMDIPGLGALFSAQKETETRTELLVFITPLVLEGEADLRAINEEMRNRMRGLTNFEDLPVDFER